MNAKKRRIIEMAMEDPVAKKKELAAANKAKKKEKQD
jgi:hypothetical protein